MWPWWALNLSPRQWSNDAGTLFWQPISWSMASLHYFIAVTLVCSQAIPLAMMTMRKSIHGIPFLSYIRMGLCLAALWATRALLKLTALLIAVQRGSKCSNKHLLSYTSKQAACWNKTIVKVNCYFQLTKSVDSMLPWISSVTDHRWCQNVVRTKKGSPHAPLFVLATFWRLWFITEQIQAQI